MGPSARRIGPLARQTDAGSSKTDQTFSLRMGRDRSRRELRKAFSELRAQFDRWDRGEIDPCELNELVHRFHQDTAGEIWKRYTTTRLEPAVASAVAGRASQRGAARPTCATHRRFHRILRTRPFGIVSRNHVRQARNHGQTASKDEPTSHGRVAAAIFICVEPARSRPLHEMPDLRCLDSDSKTPAGRSRRTSSRAETRSFEQNMPPLFDLRNADRRSSRIGEHHYRRESFRHGQADGLRRAWHY
jgi:hypothetical protein